MASSDSKQIQVLRFIHEYQEKNGFPPTIREIGEAVGLSSSSTIHGHIARLIKNGYLEKKGEGNQGPSNRSDA